MPFLGLTADFKRYSPVTINAEKLKSGLGLCRSILQDSSARNDARVPRKFAAAAADYSPDASSTKLFFTIAAMDSVNRSITERGRPVTKRSHAAPGGDQNSHLTSLHLQILQWVEGRRAGQTRPQLIGVAPPLVDRAVAELVIAGLVKAVAIPPSKYDHAHWQPTSLTALGWEALVRHRRSLPRPAPQPWWRLTLAKLTNFRIFAVTN